MGYLQRLELENFKSYAGKQTIGPFDRFTAVIGPNGAGKSNLMDAISFVLGINSGQLRSAHLGELVHRPIGGETDENVPSSTKNAISKRAKSGKMPTKASVSAYYAMDDRVVVMSRSVAASTGASEYRIDGRVKTFAEYADFLASQNILVKARNFLVFQGDVESVASKTGKELTRLFEQVCGSEDFKADYERLFDEQERALEASAMAFNQKRAVVAEMRSITSQKEDVVRFEELDAKRGELIIEQMLWKLFHLEASAKQAADEITAKQSEVKVSNDHAKVAEEEHQAAKRTQARAQKELLLFERKVKKAQQDYDQQAPEALELSEKKRLLGQKHKAQMQAVNAAIAEHAKQQSEAEAARAELQELERARARFEESAQTQMSVARLTPELMAEYGTLKQDLNNRVAKESLKLDNLERKRAPDLATKKQHEDKCHELALRNKQLAQEQEMLEDRIRKSGAALKSVDDEIASIQTSESSTQARKKKLQQVQAEMTERLRTVVNKLLLVRADQQESERELKLRSTIETLRRIFPGVHGRLIDLCQPVDRKFDVALSIVLGRNTDAIVVEHEKTAIECIRYMRAQRCGQATLIPLDTIQVKPTSEKYRSLVDGARPAIDVFKYEGMFEKAVQYACGNAIVCDTLAIARHICYDRNERVKSVTLDGSIVHKSGLLTGGISGTERASKWDDKEVNALKRERDQCQSTIAEGIRALKRIDAESSDRARLAELNTARLGLLAQIGELQEHLQGVQQELAHNLDRLEQEQQALQAAVKGLSKYDKEIEALDAAIREEEAAVFAAFCRRIGVDSIRDYEHDRMQVARAVDERRLEFVTASSKLRNKLAFFEEDQADFDERLRLLKHQLAQHETALQEMHARLADIEEGRAKSRHALDAVLHEQSALKTALEREAANVAAAKQAASKAQAEADRIAALISGAECQLEKLLELRSGLIRRCKLEEVALPLSRGSLEAVPLEDGPESATASIVVDFARLKRDDRKRSDDAYEQSRFASRLAEVQADIDRLAPNLRALDKLEAAEARLQASLEAFEEARVAARNAKDAFQDVRAKRLAAFMPAFKHISENIDKVYKELNRTGATTGGNAYLTLENSEEPYLDGIRFHAMPPGKRFLDMDQLSGGERTIAALALLFAIHSYRPSPFFILDEIDAALDHGNVQRVTAYLHSQTQSGVQLIVISLKPALYERADSLVGIYRDNAPAASIDSTLGSRVLTLRLTDYPE